jgi:hypothetical protein
MSPGRGTLTCRRSLAAAAAAACSLLGAGSAAAAPPQPSPEAYRSAGTVAAWYELRLPAGQPRGIVLMFHGGAWRNVGQDPVRRLADYRGGELAREWRERGFITVVSTYSAGEAGWTNVVSVYDQLHARYPDLPIGAYGQSAGAHSSLLLGAVRHLAFVVSDAGPTDWATWRSAYPCFRRDCAVITSGFAGYGAYWVGVEIPGVFGAASAPAPNMNDYDVSPNYGPTSGPDVFLIYGRRYVPSDPARTQIVDGTPTDGVNANAYIDADDDLATLDDELETDQLVTQQQGVFLKDKIGARAILRTIPRGDSAWIHAYVDADIARAVYSEMLDWSETRTAAATPAPAAKAPLAVPPVASLLPGNYVVRTCNAAPPGSGVFSTGAWRPQITAVGLDAAEAGCSSAGAGQARGEGMELRARPSAAAAVADRAAATMTFTAPPATTVSRYETAYRGARSDRGWAMRLTASGASGSVLASCGAGAPCASAPDAFAPPGTVDPSAGPVPTQSLQPPTGTTSLTWSLTCEQPAGCAGQDPAFLDVYASRITITDHASPAPASFVGEVRGGKLSGTVYAADNGGGVRRVDVTAVGALRTSYPVCDFSRPQPCPSRHQFAIDANVGGLAILRFPLILTTVDAAGRSTTNITLVRVSR